jgi:hypothetical protein
MHERFDAGVNADRELSRVGDIEVGYDLTFERRWYRVQQGCRYGAAILLVLGVAGLFGRGPLSRTTSESDDRRVALRYERLARARTPAPMELMVRGPAAASGKLRVRIHGAVTERTRLQQFMPEPVAIAASGNDLILEFETQPSSSSTRITFLQEPLGAGRVDGEVRVDQAGSARLSQLVLP